MSNNAPAVKAAPSWRKARRPLLLKIAFALILAGFVSGYIGGIHDLRPLIAGAFAFWGAASALALLAKS